MAAYTSDALIVDAVRSPIGKRDGTLSKIRGDELAAQVLNALVERNDLDPAEIEDVQLGCVTQIGEQGWNLGRMVPFVAADELQRRDRDLVQTAGSRRLRRRRDDVARADGVERRRPLGHVARP